VRAYLPTSLPPVTAVDVVVLSSVEPDNLYEFMHFASDAPTTRIEGKDARWVAHLWRRLPFGDIAKCHVPPYGLRFFFEDNVICQGSICWGCNNIYGDVVGDPFTCGFDAGSAVSGALLAELQRIAPNDHYRRQVQISRRAAELREIMQSPYGMEKLMKIWREHYNIPDGLFPPTGVTPESQILRKEFPDAE